jgi:transcriptional regulator with AAA-type ATPase domain
MVSARNKEGSNMTRLSLSDELADLRVEIARLRQREATLVSMAQNFPAIPVFRRGWPMRRDGASMGVRA